MMVAVLCANLYRDISKSLTSTRTVESVKISKNVKTFAYQKLFFSREKNSLETKKHTSTTPFFQSLCNPFWYPQNVLNCLPFYSIGIPFNRKNIKKSSAEREHYKKYIKCYLRDYPSLDLLLIMIIFTFQTPFHYLSADFFPFFISSSFLTVVWADAVASHYQKNRLKGKGKKMKLLHGDKKNPIWNWMGRAIADKRFTKKVNVVSLWYGCCITHHLSVIFNLIVSALLSSYPAIPL